MGPPVVSYDLKMPQSAPVQLMAPFTTVHFTDISHRRHSHKNGMDYRECFDSAIDQMAIFIDQGLMDLSRAIVCSINGLVCMCVFVQTCVYLFVPVCPELEVRLVSVRV